MARNFTAHCNVLRLPMQL